MIKQSSGALRLCVLVFPVVTLAASLVLSSCTGMLLGGSSGGSGRPLGSDTRSTSQVSTDNAISAEIRERLSGDHAVSRFRGSGAKDLVGAAAPRG